MISVSTIFENYYLLSRDPFVIKAVVTGNIQSIIFYVIFIVIALVLNNKEKYLENSIMCGTLLSSYIISTVLFYGNVILSQWLK